MIFVHKHQYGKHGMKHMQATHRKHVKQVEHDSKNFINLTDKNWNSYKLMNQREWDKGCTYHHSWRIWETGKTSGGLAYPWDRQITLVCLVPCRESAVDVVQCLCGRSQVFKSMISLGDLPHTCSCTWCCLQIKWEKQKRGSTDSRTREPLFKFKYKFTTRPSSNKAVTPRVFA
jgi:hypothetical protein